MKQIRFVTVPIGAAFLLTSIVGLMGASEIIKLIASGVGLIFGIWLNYTAKDELDS